MCGRYAASKKTDDLVEELHIDLDATADPVRSVLKSPQNPPAGQPDYNIAPTKNARVALTRDVDGEPVRQLRLLTWGLVPPWAKSPKDGLRMTNARAETLLNSRAFARPAARRRALVPADGWYEWQLSPTALDAKGKPRKQPFFIHRVDGASTVFAGLYEFWRDPAGEEGDPQAWLTTYTIITTAAPAGLDRIHDRAPLVLDPEHWDAWLDPATTDPDVVAALLAPGDPPRFVAHPVDRAVGASSANGPQLVQPVDPALLQGVVDPMTGEIIG